MAHTTIIQDVRSMMYPEILLAQIVNRGYLKLLAIFWDEVLNLSIVVLNNFMETLRNNSGRMNNTSDLCSQIVLLSTKEEWIGKDGSLQVASEENLNLTGSLDVSRCQVRKLDPLIEDVISDPVSELINTSALSLLISGTAFTLTTFFATLDNTFSNVIILLSASDLSEETDRTSAELLSEVLQASLDPPCLNLTESDASPLIDLRVSNQISNVPDGTDLLSLGLTALFALLTSCLLLFHC